MAISIENNRSKYLLWTIISGIVLGIAGVLLLRLGNPPNMGICGACFLRDVSGGLMLFTKPAGLQYLRPEIPGFILGAFIAALLFKEFRSRGGTSPAVRFLVGAFIMTGALVFLGCPLRLIERLAGGDYITGGIGFLGMLAGIATGALFIRGGFTLGAGRDQARPAALFMPLLGLSLLIFVLYLHFSANDPNGLLNTKRHAPVLAAHRNRSGGGLFFQRSRFCTTGGYRDVILTGDLRLIWGYAALFITLVAGNIAVDQFFPGSGKQFELGAAPIAHYEHLWNFLGTYLMGLGSILLGGCPIRQVIAASQGNTDAGMTVIGMIVGAAFCHNFGLASKPFTEAAAGGPSTAGMVAVVVGILVCLGLGIFCKNRK